MPEQMQISRLTSYDNVRIVDAIVDEGEDGYFANTARLVDQVLRDARLCSVLMTRVLGLLGKKLDLEPAKDTAKGRKIAEEIESDWPSMFSHAALTELLIWGIMLGVGLGRIVEDTDPWHLEIWHPWCLQWDSDRRQYSVDAKGFSKIWLTVDKNGQFFDEQGGRWVLYTPFGYDAAGRRGLLRAVHRLYLERQWSHRDRARYSEIFGQPLRFGIAPLNSTKEERDAYRDRLLPLGAESVVVGTQGEDGNRWDLKLVEAAGKSTELFQAQIEQLDREIATLLLGQSQSTDGQGGLGNQEKAGESVRLDIMRADNDTLSDTLRKQFLVPYCEFTYGAGDLAPWVCRDIEPAEDLAAKANEFKSLMEGLSIAKTMGAPVDVRAVLESHNIPMVSEEEQVAMEAKKAADLAAAAQPVATKPANGVVAAPATH